MNCHLQLPTNLSIRIASRATETTLPHLHFPQLSNLNIQVHKLHFFLKKGIFGCRRENDEKDEAKLGACFIKFWAAFKRRCHELF